MLVVLVLVLVLVVVVVVGSWGRGVVCVCTSASLAQVQQFKSWLPHFHCSCGERFKFVDAGSRTVGAAAVWELKCCGGCAPVHLATSASLWEDDFEVNYDLQLASETCPIIFGRLNDMLRFVGLGQLSMRDNNRTKAECEQPLANQASVPPLPPTPSPFPLCLPRTPPPSPPHPTRQAHAAMAKAWENEQLAGVTDKDDCLCLDDGWNHGRNGSECTQPVMSAMTGRLLLLEHSRRSDPGVKSSQARAVGWG